MENLSAKVSVGNQSSNNYFCALDIKRGCVGCISQRNLSLPSHQKAILSVEKVITTISYSRMTQREVKQNHSHAQLP